MRTENPRPGSSLILNPPLGIFSHSTIRMISMVKLVALYRAPSDVTAFDRHYFDVHLPLVRKTPGLRTLEVVRITGSPIGETPYHLMAEMTYDSIDAMNEANASSEGKAVARDLMSFASDTLTLFFGEVRQ